MPATVEIVCKNILLQRENLKFVLKEEDDYENKGSRRRAWDDEFVLKRQFSALIPAFDPRPGRTNINQTQDFEIPAPGAAENGRTDERDTVLLPKLALFLKGPSLPGVRSLLTF